MPIAKDIQIIFFWIILFVYGQIHFLYYSKKAKKLGIPLKEYSRSPEVFKKQALFMLPVIPLLIGYFLIQGTPLVFTLIFSGILIGFYALFYYALMREFKKRKQ